MDERVECLHIIPQMTRGLKNTIKYEGDKDGATNVMYKNFHRSWAAPISKHLPFGLTSVYTKTRITYPRLLVLLVM